MSLHSNIESRRIGLQFLFKFGAEFFQDSKSLAQPRLEVISHRFLLHLVKTICLLDDVFLGFLSKQSDKFDLLFVASLVGGLNGTRIFAGVSSLFNVRLQQPSFGSELITHGSRCLFLITFAESSGFFVIVSNGRPSTSSGIRPLATSRSSTRQYNISKLNIFVFRKLLDLFIPGRGLLYSSASSF